MLCNVSWLVYFDDICTGACQWSVGILCFLDLISIYLLRSTKPTLSTKQKEEVLAGVRAFNYSGFSCKLQGNVIRHHQSFGGRDYKAWAQMALSIMWPYLANGQRSVDCFSQRHVIVIQYCNTVLSLF